MYGNGSGLANENINKAEAAYYDYLSYEKVLGGGSGYKQESLNFMCGFKRANATFKRSKDFTRENARE